MTHDTSRHCISEKQDSLATVRLSEQRMNRNILELESQNSSKHIKTIQREITNEALRCLVCLETVAPLRCQTSHGFGRSKVLRMHHTATPYSCDSIGISCLCEYIGGCMLYYATMIHNVRDGHEKCKGTLWMLICCL